MSIRMVDQNRNSWCSQQEVDGRPSAGGARPLETASRHLDAADFGLFVDSSRSSIPNVVNLLDPGLVIEIASRPFRQLTLKTDQYVANILIVI